MLLLYGSEDSLRVGHPRGFLEGKQKIQDGQVYVENGAMLQPLM